MKFYFGKNRSVWLHPTTNVQSFTNLLLASSSNKTGYFTRIQYFDGPQGLLVGCLVGWFYANISRIIYKTKMYPYNHSKLVNSFNFCCIINVFQNLRINFYLLRTFCPHLGSFLCCFFFHYVLAKFHLWPSSGDFTATLDRNDESCNHIPCNYCLP